MTDIITQDLSELLRRSDPNNLADIFREGFLDLRRFLEDVKEVTTDVVVVDGSLQTTLSKTPIGPVVCAFTEGAAHVPLTQMPDGGTLAATEFSVDYATGVLTAGGTVADTEELTVIYLGLTKGSGNGSLLAERLAKPLSELK